MSSIVGLEGLEPTIKLLNIQKKLLLQTRKLLFVHGILLKNWISLILNLYQLTQSTSLFGILLTKKLVLKLKIYLTASGGSLLNTPLKKFNDLKIKDVLKHPNWKMGNKITVTLQLWWIKFLK